MPVCCSAVRTATRSVASETTSNDSPRSLTSSAPASSTAASTSSSEIPSCFGTITTPLRLNRNDTDPGSAIVPPLRVIAVRTSDAARLRLSVRHSTSSATPPGPYPSYMIVWYSAPPPSAPEPRLTARSMLSLGTEDFFAFWMASYSVGFPPGSPPPIRAATSLFLMSLAKSLPRRASITAFLCLVVAHLECPDMRPLRLRLRSVGAAVSVGGGLAHHVEEERVDARVPGDLGVERGGDQVPLPDRDDPTGGLAGGLAGRHPSQHLDPGPDLLHPGGADEHRVERLLE